MWDKAAATVGRPELINDKRFLTNLDQVQNADIPDEIIGGFIGERTLAENPNLFEGAGITVCPICDPTDFIGHEFIRGHGVIEDFPDNVNGKIPCTLCSLGRDASWEMLPVGAGQVNCSEPQISIQ